ncbi:envelope glycoprotein [Lisianthus necrotic ringspot virus]|uniref:Envelopment polyprotein n=1 Tax=Lisianthus necrotic ringspot virus TaxID=1398661 RepID=A0AAD0KYJ1_9VIRU|nr:envelope glycoprotein [Lisianthus necrotic ringspot virus]
MISRRVATGRVRMKVLLSTVMSWLVSAFIIFAVLASSKADPAKKLPIMMLSDHDNSAMNNLGKVIRNSDSIREDPAAFLPPVEIPKMPIKTLSCTNPTLENCKIVGVSDYNIHYVVRSDTNYLGCLSEDHAIFDKCYVDGTHTKILRPSVPTVPVTDTESKRICEVGTKYYYAESEITNYPIDESSGLASGNIIMKSVRFSGECNYTSIESEYPYRINLKSLGGLIGFAIKDIKTSELLEQTTFDKDYTVEIKEDYMDGGHFLICGDRVDKIPKGDHHTRSCLSLYKNSKNLQYMCLHYEVIEWVFVIFLTTFPITWLLWKTKSSLFIWYDVLGFITFPLLFIINKIWHLNPMACHICGNFSLLSHTCTKKCVCNQHTSDFEHCKTCPICTGNFSKIKSLFAKFQLIVNTQISSTGLIWITKVFIAILILSCLPKSMAEEISCVSDCHLLTECDRIVPSYTRSCLENPEVSCSCSINDNVVYEVMVKNGNLYSENTRMANCKDYICDVQPTNNQQSLYLCARGCQQFKKHYANIRIAGIIPKYTTTYALNSTDAMHLSRIRSGIISSVRVQDVIDDYIIQKQRSYNLPPISEEVPPESMLSRQSLVYSSKVDNKYRYLIEMNIKKDSGTIYALHDGTVSMPVHIMIYVQSAGVTYKLKKLYKTAPVLYTHPDYLVTCTGSCSDCRKQKKQQKYHNFCIEPTSYRGCEEFGCLAMSEGAICGSCSNVYDMSKSMEIFEILESHVKIRLCTKFLDGYKCNFFEDKVPHKTDDYQINLNTDLHNDILSPGMKIAIDGSGNIYKGNIVSFGDPSNSFGHPQLDDRGELLFAQKSLMSSQIKWECGAVQPKIVTIKQCGYDTFRFHQSLTKISDAPYRIADQSEIFMERSFVTGNLKMVFDLNKEIFQVPSVTPKLTSVATSCTGCINCAGGLACLLEFRSDFSFSASLEWEHCTFKSSEMPIKKEFNKITMIAFCRINPEKLPIKIYPESNKQNMVAISISKMDIHDQDSIIDNNDDMSNDERTHESDNTFAKFWEWISSPFNWVASFFGSFFNIIKLIFILMIVAIIIYSLAFLKAIARSYYLNKIKKKEKIDEDGHIDLDEEGEVFIVPSPNRMTAEEYMHKKAMAKLREDLA